MEKAAYQEFCVELLGDLYYHGLFLQLNPGSKSVPLKEFSQFHSLEEPLRVLHGTVEQSKEQFLKIF